MEIASQAGRQNPLFNLQHIFSCLSLGRVLHTRTILKLAQHLQKAQLKSWQRHCSELLSAAHLYRREQTEAGVCRSGANKLMHCLESLRRKSGAPCLNPSGCFMMLQ